MKWFILLNFLCICISQSFFTYAQDGTMCSAVEPCTRGGCCSKEGYCGFGPEFCGDGCQGSCNATAECGKYAAKDNFACPLDVCCSKFGYCGTTDEFCNDDCQNKGGCPAVDRPQCSESTDAMSLDVRVGYYSMSGAERDCDASLPENIAAGALTHINLAFAGISEDFEITDENGPIVARTSRLKKKHPGLRVSIAIGGWVFNDPPTQNRFSDMVSTRPNRGKFIASLIRHIRRYSLNGVDIDWEYPVATDRGGTDLDKQNFVLLCSDIRDAFEKEDSGLQLTVTLPSSYWYLRGFDLKRLEKYIDWFNVMTYDIHGIWDQKSVWTGPYLKGHTNLTEIEDGLDLLWRADISPEKVVMGFGFYGRSFTMSDLKCYKPPSCKFDSAGFAGECTNEAGILSYSEVVSRKSQLGATVFYDEKSSVKYMTYGSNQWISFDDKESFEAKKKYLFSRCLRGLMIWSLDLDTQDHQAMTDLFGEKAMEGALTKSGLDSEEAEQLSFDLSAWTGERCYTTPTCTDGSKTERTADQVCKGGYTALEMAHSPVQKNADFTMNGDCDEGWWRYVCCPTKALPQNCDWRGAPERSAFGCDRGCGSSQFELNIDTYLDAKGEGNCFSGARSLCCDNTEILDRCHWSDCDYRPDKGPCGDDEESIGVRFDKNDGGFCGTNSFRPAGDRTMRREFCCPKKDKFEKCSWPINDCKPGKCAKDKLQVTTAQDPSWLYDISRYTSDECFGYEIPEMISPDFPLCCEPPSTYSEKWPVEPKYLWSHYYDGDDDDISWQFSDNFGNNNKDTTPGDMDDNPGTDPYGFVMLDGPPGSINNAFGSQYTVVTRDAPTNIKKRSIVTTNQTSLDSVFDHAEETILVYCNYLADSKECRQIFHKRAEDTIIRLPDHVGEGPWARVVSMEPVKSPSMHMPGWVIRKRSDNDNQNGVYELKFDYNFHAIKRDDGQVNIRVDYTNLIPYWDEMTDSPAIKRKRGTEESFTYEEWRNKVDRAKVLDTKRSSRNETGKLTARSNSTVHPKATLHRRWWGVFTEWVKKLATVTNTDGGLLPMGLVRSLVLYSGRLRCTNEEVTITAGLDITADFNMEMNARYSYYFSGTVVPPTVTDMYAYVGVHPQVYAGVGISGNAELYYPSERKKIIDTLTYPGLAIKGIAAVGPTMDLWGQIDGRVTVSGDMQVGLTYQFNPVELYFPNNEEARNTLDVEDMQSSQVDNSGLSPQISGNVRADVDINIHATPEINMGIKIGGGIGSLKGTLADAHVSAFANTTLNFHAQAKAGTNNGDNSWYYGYSVSFLYRFGFGCVAEIYKYGKWTSGIWYPFKQRVIPIYSRTISTSQSEKRSLGGPSFSEQPLSGAIFGLSSGLSAAYHFDDTEIDGYQQYGNISLTKRADGTMSDKETQFNLGSFKCTTGAGSVCDSTLSENSLSQRDLMPLSRDSTEIQKRANKPTDCPNKIPRFYYNCVAFFHDMTFSDGGGRADMEGICSNIEKFLRNNARGNSGITLTWESQRQAQRRRKSCPSKHCEPENEKIRRNLYGLGSTDKTEFTNCDEFPFASSEEGGVDFLGLAPDTPTGTVRTCVPTWQNDVQGQCNNLLNNIKTNVEYFNTVGKPTEENPSWWRWNQHSSWGSKTGLGKRQRLVPYPDPQPKSYVGGMTKEDYDDPRNLNFYHKRKFELFLSYPHAGQNPDGQFPDQGYDKGTMNIPSDKKKLQPIISDVPSPNVICAVNTMGQHRYGWAGANALCTDGVGRDVKMWGGKYPSIHAFHCRVSFMGSPYTTKRDGTPQEPLGYFGDDPYYSVERLDDTGYNYDEPESENDMSDDEDRDFINLYDIDSDAEEFY